MLHVAEDLLWGFPVPSLRISVSKHLALCSCQGEVFSLLGVETALLGYA